MKKTALTFGITAGITLVTYALLSMLPFDFGAMTSLPPDKMASQMMWAGILGYARYLILIAGIILAMRALKKEKGSITYGRALGIGVLVSLITAVFVGAMEFFYVYTHPEFFANYMKISAEMMRQGGASEADIQAQADSMKNMGFIMTPAGCFVLYFVETTIIGTFTSLVAALFFRK